MAKRTDTKGTMIAGDVCLYGSRSSGFHYLARSAAGGKATLIGEGDRSEGRVPFTSATLALWHAVDAIRATGAPGFVRVFDVGGTRYADVRFGTLPAVGDLKWQTVPVTGVALAG
jgi:hypothetical protein